MKTQERVTRAPDFRLDDLDGNPVTLQDYREKQHVVLVLLRGLW